MRADWIELRRRCEHCVTELLRHVTLPNPWDINTFLDDLECHLGREIDLCAVPWTFGDSTGAWKRMPGHDVIAYPQNTTSLHQDHIILHEIGHMICDHRGSCVLSWERAQKIASTLRPAALMHLLGRVTAQADEVEAETIATMILARIAAQDRRRSPRNGQHLDDETAATLTKLTSTFDQL